MTVTGTEQRVYGTLVGGCIIDLHRFALVSGSTTLSPPNASTVVYADTTPYKQCGYKYAGYLTLFLSISGSSVYAAVEVRICKNDAKRIVLETYGEVAKTVTGGMSLWFNKGTNAEPDWVKLNSTNSGIIMPYATTSYTFKESKRNGSITIDCCKKCPSCGCKNCNVDDRFALSTVTNADVSSICCNHLTMDSLPDVPVDKLTGRTIRILSDTGIHAYTTTIAGISGNVIECDTSNFICHQPTSSLYNAVNTNDYQVITDSWSPVPNPNIPPQFKIYSPFGWYADNKITFSLTYNIVGGITGGYNLADYMAWIHVYLQTNQIDVAWNQNMIQNATSTNVASGTYDGKLLYRDYYGKTFPVSLAVEVGFNSNIPQSYKDGEGVRHPTVVTFNISATLNSVIDCRGNDRLGEASFICIPASPNTASYYSISLSDGTSISSSAHLHYGYDSKGGDQSLVYYDDTTPAFAIEYKLTCDTIFIWAYSIGDINLGYIKVTFRDDDDIINTIYEDFESLTATSFPFDYLKNCMVFTYNTNCCEYITVTSTSIGKTVKEMDKVCPIVGKKLQLTGSSDVFTGTIENIIDDNTLKLDRNSLTSTKSNLQSTFIYDKNKEFLIEYGIGYRNMGDYGIAEWYYSYDFGYPMHPDIAFISFDYEMDIDVTHTPTGNIFKQQIYYIIYYPDGYILYNDYAYFEFYYKKNLGTWVTSPTRCGLVTGSSGTFPISGSNSGKTTRVDACNWPIHYQGTTTLETHFRLFAMYQAPHEYTGQLKLRIFNIRYFNCRGEEIVTGDKCLPILNGLSGKILPPI